MPDPRPTASSVAPPADLLECLAAVEHERWAHWQRYLHGLGERNADGSLTLPAEAVTRWDRQIETPYAELSEREKESDKAEVLRYWPLIAQWEDWRRARLA